jgi:hypothetical protein
LEPIVDRVIMRTARRLGNSLRENAILLLLVVILLVAALVATALSPYLLPV